MEYTFTCGPLSTTIKENSVHPVTTPQQVKPNVMGRGVYFWFDEFEVTNANCPITKTEITKDSIVNDPGGAAVDNGMEPTITPFLRWDNTTVTNRNSFKTAALDPFIEGVYDFWIRVSAKGGRQYDKKVRFIVDAECEKQDLDWNRPVVNISLLQNSTNNGNPPYYEDLSPIFYTGDPVFCRIIKYELKKVRGDGKHLELINSTTGKPFYENTFTFDPTTAKVRVHDTSRLIKFWELYVVAYTTKKVSFDLQYNMLLSVHRGPNFAPRFKSAAPMIIINIANYPTANSYYSYKIDEYFD